MIEFVLCIRVAGSLLYMCEFVRATWEFRSSWGGALLEQSIFEKVPDGDGVIAPAAAGRAPVRSVQLRSGQDFLS
jgi:hypothetical protein